MGLKYTESGAKFTRFDGSIVKHLDQKVFYFPIRLRFTNYQLAGSRGIAFRIAKSCSSFNMIESFFVYEVDNYGITRPVKMPPGKYSTLVSGSSKTLRGL